MTAHEVTARAELSFGRAWGYAGLVVGILDIADAIVFYAFRGVAPARIFQSVAAGLLGRAAFSGGAYTAWLGGALHFFNAFAIAIVYLAAARRIRTLVRHPWLWGPLYGIAVYVVMFHVIIPLSAATPTQLSTGALVNEILIHLLGVGLPVGLFAARMAASHAPARGDTPPSAN